MSFGYISYLPAYLEHFAVEVLKRHGRWLDVTHLAVDVELMLENQGYHVVSVKGLPHHVEAYIAYHVRKVFVREYDDQRPRARMSLAEEFAHIILHIPELLKHDPLEPIGVVQQYSVDEYERLERDAKYFAGALLMDATLFKKLFRKYRSKEFGRDLSDRKSDLWALRQVAADFHVGITCATMRAYQLGLVEKEVLQIVSS